MPSRQNRKSISLFVTMVIAVAAGCGVSYAGGKGNTMDDFFSAFFEKDGPNNAKVTLFVCLPDSNEMTVAEPNSLRKIVEQASGNANLPGNNHLVIITHGWFEDEPWPTEMAMAIKKKADSKKWLCGWYDWRQEARTLNPVDAAKYGRDIAGPVLGQRIIDISKKWQHIHLIGHSSGAWVISEAAKVIARQTGASIHITFLDAFIPPFWKENKLGDLGEPNIPFWAEHYFTSDISLGTTAKQLKHAYNVDITDITPGNIPGFSNHRFPFHWYYATITGQYAPKQKYEGKKLFTHIGNMEYGFARSLETGWEGWHINKIVFAAGNKPVKIKSDKKPFDLFRWISDTLPIKQEKKQTSPVKGQ